MISSLLAMLTLVAGPACAAQAALQAPPAPAPVRAIKPTELNLEPSDLKQVTRQSPDGATQPVPPAMVLIPGGDTIIGTDPAKVPEYGQNAADRMKDVSAETPRHTVKVEAFYIDLTEVTNLQWKVYLEATKRKPSPTLVMHNWPEGEIPEGQDDYPVSNVNIPEIRDYLHWCGKRLPTEAEWTRAARGDDDRHYPWGTTWNSKLCHSGTTGATGPVAVGSLPGGASPYGVLDMVGNVFEWVDSPFTAFDGFEPYAYKQGKKTIPLSPGFNSTFKTIKGGGFSTVRLDSRIDTRLGLLTTNSDAVIGFRAARSEKTGVDVVRHALDRLLPPVFSKPGSIDLADICAKEVNEYDPARRVLTNYRYLAFAHRAPSRLPPLSKLRDDSVDEPLALGVLTTSEPVIMKHMPLPPGTHKAGAVTVLPAGQFTLAFKGKGVSKAHKEKLRLEKKAGKKPEPEPAAEEPKADTKASAKGGAKARAGSKAAKEAEAAAEAAAKAEAEAAVADAEEPATGEGSPGGVMVPWPGVGSIHDIQEDVDFPQEEDVFLFYNANNVVVAWSKCEEIHEVDVSPATFESAEDGHAWTIGFSIDTLNKKAPRFTLPIHLAGDGLR